MTKRYTFFMRNRMKFYMTVDDFFGKNINNEINNKKEN